MLLQFSQQPWSNFGMWTVIKCEINTARMKSKPNAARKYPRHKLRYFTYSFYELILAFQLRNHFELALHYTVEQTLRLLSPFFVFGFFCPLLFLLFLYF